MEAQVVSLFSKVVKLFILIRAFLPFQTFSIPNLFKRMPTYADEPRIQCHYQGQGIVC
jgi:hypothetical protein